MSEFTDEDRARVEKGIALLGEVHSYRAVADSWTRALAHIDQLEQALRGLADELEARADRCESGDAPGENYYGGQALAYGEAAELARAALKGEDE